MAVAQLRDLLGRDLVGVTGISDEDKIIARSVTLGELQPGEAGKWHWSTGSCGLRGGGNCGGFVHGSRLPATALWPEIAAVRSWTRWPH